MIRSLITSYCIILSIGLPLAFGVVLDYKCNGTISCPSPYPYAFYSASTLYCWSPNDDIITYCNGTALVPYASSPVPFEAPCHGRLRFAIGRAQYSLNDTTLYTLKDGAWSVVENGSYWFLGRLRPNEATGWVYCYTSSPPYDSSRFFYYDGTYHDIETDATGKVVKKAQTVSQYNLQYYLTDNTETGCTNPVCCWFKDAVNREIIYNEQGWQIWQDGTTYNAYGGEFNPLITKCAQHFNNATFTDPHYLYRDVAYTTKDGLIYQISGSGSLIQVVADIDISDYFDYDPEAKGSIYFFDPLAYQGRYQNRSGVFWVNITGGVFNYQEIPYQCSDKDTVSVYGTSGNPYPYCNSTENHYEPFFNPTCDPADRSNPCGENMRCVAMSDYFEWPQQCLKGICVPDYDGICRATTTSTTTTSSTTTVDGGTTTTMTTTKGITKSTVLRKYASRCTYGFDCFTGICTDGYCSCTNCTKILPGINYDPRFNLLTYTERCIPKTALIVGAGDMCDMWADVPTRYCGMGMICGACPETWDSKFFEAKCVPAVKYQPQNVSCPKSMICDYGCDMIGGLTASCICPKGFNLEPNLHTCYGWQTDVTAVCNVTCGNGYKEIRRRCIRGSGIANCEGSSEGSFLIPCIGRFGQCTVNATMLPAAVIITFPTQLVTVDLFIAKAKESIHETLTSALNEACAYDRDLYENQCCPGKEFPEDNVTVHDCINEEDGVRILNEFFEGSYFSFYALAQGDAGSSCCNRSMKEFHRRRKRSTYTNYFDQYVLASYILSSENLALINEAIQKIDPSVALTNGSVYGLTTTTHAPKPTTEAPKIELVGIAAITTAVSGTIAAVIAVSVACPVIGFVLWRYIKKRREKLKVIQAKRGKAVGSMQPILVKPAEASGANHQALSLQESYGYKEYDPISEQAELDIKQSVPKREEYPMQNLNAQGQLAQGMLAIGTGVMNPMSGMVNQPLPGQFAQGMYAIGQGMMDPMGTYPSYYGSYQSTRGRTNVVTARPAYGF